MGRLRFYVSYLFELMTSFRGRARGYRTRLMLVFSLNLKDIKEIGSRSMDLDEILVRSRLGVREVLDFELMRGLVNV